MSVEHKRGLKAPPFGPLREPVYDFLELLSEIPVLFAQASVYDADLADIFLALSLHLISLPEEQ